MKTCIQSFEQIWVGSVDLGQVLQTAKNNPPQTGTSVNLRPRAESQGPTASLSAYWMFCPDVEQLEPESRGNHREPSLRPKGQPPSAGNAALT